MHVIELQADNFKRLRAVTVIPNGPVVEISGDNGAGKTSTLDAMWAALGGKDACPEKPIRSGSETAILAGDEKSEVRLILGENGAPKLKVTRRFKARADGDWTTDLIVETPEGARFNKPQDILSSLVGTLCFDPLAFTRLPDKDQIGALRSFVPEVDFATLEGLNRRDFETRADVNRTIKSLKGQLDAMPQSAGDVPDRVDTDALEGELANAADWNADVERRKGARTQAEVRIQGIAIELANLQTQVDRLTAERDGLQKRLNDAEALPQPMDVADIRAKLEEGRRINALVDRAAGRQRLEQQIAEKDEEAARLTQAMDRRKADASAAVAKARMPVDGLGFAEDANGQPYVTLSGEPFSQASQAQQIRASVAIAAAMNPELRVAMIKDGSLLDRKSWQALTDYATANNLQVWAETVDPKTAGAVIIEDGGVRGAETPAAAQIADEIGDVL